MARRKVVPMDPHDGLARRKAMLVVAQAVLGRNNLIGTDFDDIKANRTSKEFPQLGTGIRLQFVVSQHALSKVMAPEVEKALQVLLGD